MEETPKNEHVVQVEMKMEQLESKPKLYFFGGSRWKKKSKENTWIISVFVVIQLVVFGATMIVNDCPRKSNGNCLLASVGRISFQPLSENPLLGPSSSTLDDMGALDRKLLIQHHQSWRILTAPWLHAGIFDLIINLSTVIFIGIHLEQAFGSWRIGILYTFSAFIGSLMASLFVNNIPAVASSAALFGLLGAMLSALIRYWNLYSDKYRAFFTLLSLATTNSALGFLPHVDNYSNFGGFLSGILLGFLLLFDPQLGQVPQNKRGLFDYNDKSAVSFKNKLDKPVLRGICLLLFSLVFAGGLVAVLHGVNANNYCSWCQYIDCIPSKIWSCNGEQISCKVTINAGRLTVACKRNDKYRTYPFTDISKARIGDLCSQICS